MMFFTQTKSRKEKKQHLFGESGRIQCRTTKSSLLFKRWSMCYWLHVQPATIVVFETVEDMVGWKLLHMHQDINTNRPIPTAEITDESIEKERNNLVLWSINFHDAICSSKIKNINRKQMGQSYTKKSNSGYSRSNNDTPYDKLSKVSNADCKNQSRILSRYFLESTKQKYYMSHRSLMYAFKLSYMGTAGKSVKAAFGSSSLAELNNLQKCIRQCLKLNNASSSKLIKRKEPSKESHARLLAADYADMYSPTSLMENSNFFYSLEPMSRVSPGGNPNYKWDSSILIS